MEYKEENWELITEIINRKQAIFNILNNHRTQVNPDEFGGNDHAILENEFECIVEEIIKEINK